MARKRTIREKGYYYDPKTKQHQWTFEKDGKRYRTKNRDEATARREYLELKRRLEDGVDVKGARAQLKTYLPDWIDTEVSGKQSTRDDYHKRADLYILPTFGDWAIEDIKRRHVLQWVDWCMNESKEGAHGRVYYWARGSVKQALGMLRRCLESAIPEFIEYNPCAGIKVPMHRKGDEYKIDDVPVTTKIFTPEQMQAFLSEVERTDPYHGLHAYYALMIDYGWRRGEGLGLRRKDVDFEARTITIAQQVIRNPITNEKRITIPKSEAGKRVLPASEEALRLLRMQILRAGAQRPTDLLFPGKDGEERQPNGITQHMRRTCNRLGYEGYTLHSLRKYAITDWRADGVDLEVAAAMAGHKGINVTAEVYSQATMERKRAAVERKKRTS